MNSYVIDPEQWGIIEGTDPSNAVTNKDNFIKAMEYAKAEGYYKVTLPKGTYMIDGVNNAAKSPEIGAGIRVPGNLEVEITPDTTMKVKPNDSYGYTLFYVAPSEKNVKFSGGGYLIGERYEHDYSYQGKDGEKASHEWGFGIYFHGAHHGYVEQLKIIDFTGDGIFLGAKGMIDYPGMEYNFCYDIHIKECFISNNRRNNISITAAEVVRVKDCIITRAGAEDGCAPRFGIDIEGYGEGTIDYEEIKDVLIEGCTFLENVNASVSNFNGYGVRIVNNEADHRINYGSGTDTIIADNTMIRTDGLNTAIQGDGTSAAQKGNNALVIGNTIKGFSKGIDVRGRGVSVIGNIITEMHEDAVGIITHIADSVLVAGNKVMDDHGTAYKIDQSTNVSFVGNEASQSKERGLDIFRSSSVRVQGFHTAEGYTGIRIQSSEVSFHDVEVDFAELENQGYGITFDAASKVDFDNVTVKKAKNLSILGTATDKRLIMKDVKIIESKYIVPVQITGGTKHFIDRLYITTLVSGGRGLNLINTDGAIVNGLQAFSASADASMSAPLVSTSAANTVLTNSVYEGRPWMLDTDKQHNNLPI